MEIVHCIPIRYYLILDYRNKTRSPERDYDERYEDIPGAPECWHDGYTDGQDHPFNHDRNEECKDNGNQYYRAFIHGC
jgi:hypothetical protein